MNAMKILEINRVLFCCLILMMGMTGCDENVVDFGFDGAISGTVQDESGSIVPGNITSNTLVVRAQGEGDEVSTDIRVKGDGTFQHTKLYPKTYKVWIEGPVTLVTDTLMIDFAQDKNVTKDIVVVPFISIAQPAVVGSPTSASVDISYNMTANGGKTVGKREVYVSTVPYPSGSTGSGPFYDTKKVALPANAGQVSVTGLAAQTKYFVRIGAEASGANGFNYSEQITITTP